MTKIVSETEVDLPLEYELARKSGEIRNKLAELSYLNVDRAVELMRVWGEHKMHITPLHALLVDEIKRMKDIKEVS